MPRNLPDPNLHLRESSDFILNSRLGRLALQSEAMPGLAVFLRDLLEEMHKLAQSCHLPEFTDHGLPHVCSLVDRISEWTCVSQEGGATHLCDLIAQEEGAVLLLATIFHDIGMLSQNPEDMPDSRPDDLDLEFQDTAYWVRKTHVMRMRGLLRRLFGDHSLHNRLFTNIDAQDPVERAFKVAETHDKWPWEEEGLLALPQRDQGLAAVLAVADLLDEDATRCDTDTLLHHRQDSMRSIGHWIRHGLTLHRVGISEGKVRVDLGHPRSTDAGFDVVYSALRNHYRLVGLYNKALTGIEAGELTVDLVPQTGIPGTEAGGVRDWQRLDGLATQEALVFHLLSSFWDFALLRGKTKAELEQLGAGELEEIDLTFLDHIHIKDGVEMRSFDEQCFYALLADFGKESDTTSETAEPQTKAILRREIALDFLKKRALKAHRRGEGNQVNLFVALAIEHVHTWQTETPKEDSVRQASVSFADWCWSIVLGLYWLVDNQVLARLKETLRNSAPSSKQEEDLKQVLQALMDLVWEPLYEGKHLTDTLRKSELSWICEENSEETEVMLGFLIEMLFRRDIVKMKSRWSDLALHWLGILENRPQASRVQRGLERMRTRLSVQAKVVWPGITGRDPEYLDTLLSQDELKLYQAWQALLNMEWKSLDSLLMDLTPALSVETPHKIAAYRLHNTTRLLRGFKGDPQSIGVMRSRLHIGFGLIRSKALREAVEASWGKTEPGKANERFHAFRLALLGQIDALRHWDLVTWLVVAQELMWINLELIRHVGPSPEFAVQALWWGVLSLNLNVKDSGVRKAVGILEVADEKFRSMIVQALLRTRPIEYAKAATLFGQMSDAIPENLLCDVAEWYVQYVQYPQRGYQLELFPLSFWADILPVVDEAMAAEICRTLEPAMKVYFQIPAVWVHDAKEKKMLTLYLKHTPLDVAVKSAVGMLQMADVPPEADEVRWTLVYNATRTRKEFRDRVKDELSSSAHYAHTKYYAQFLEDNETGPRSGEQSELRDFCRTRILSFADVILSRSDGRSISLASAIPASIVGQVEWRDEDRDVIDRLIQVVDKEQYCAHLEKEEAIAIVAKIVAKGPQSLAHRVTGHLLHWLNQPPVGHSAFDTWSGPLSPMQFSGPGPDDIISNLAFLASEMVTKSPDNIVETVGRWVMRQRFSSSPKTWAEIIFLAMTIAKHGPPSLNLQMAASAQVVLARALQNAFTSPDGDAELIHVLSQIRSLMDQSQTTYNIYSGIDKDARDWFLWAVKDVIQQIVSYPNHDVRAAAARLLRLWKEQGSLPDELNETVTKFESDARGIVRYQIRGWA